MREYRPTHVGTVTKYVFVDSPLITPEELELRAYEISKGVMIKETCFGLQVTGTPEEVKKLTDQLRTMDPSHIFIKDRGFPPGDPRRCRANLGGARPGYHGHEFELTVIPYISHGLETESTEASRPMVVKEEQKLDVKVLKKMMEAEEQ